ncbi:DUF3515 family protein [Cellulomonas alba]|uniref:DUF3515 family protein n=1 Tax=Cellulomonas alba TaxID=3053467 RepID=A0ABT7SCU8_9CELL|nr:DUF3515 family protein [Cellulomonas alba]MDM7853966.1 DUF3515 family protein [Cellulomonas alba]
MPRHLTRVVVPTASSALLLGALAGCASAVPVDVAPSATDPVCARVVLDTPSSLGSGLERRRTDAQATTAWGSPSDPIVLRCGVTPLGPTTDKCVTVETPGGPSIDWVAVASQGEDDPSSDWTFTTYGRVPAVEVHVPAAVATAHSTAFLDALGQAVSHTRKERACV